MCTCICTQAKGSERKERSVNVWNGFRLLGLVLSLFPSSIHYFPLPDSFLINWPLLWTWEFRVHTTLNELWPNCSRLLFGLSHFARPHPITPELCTPKQMNEWHCSTPALLALALISYTIFLAHNATCWKHISFDDKRRVNILILGSWALFMFLDESERARKHWLIWRGNVQLGWCKLAGWIEGFIKGSGNGVPNEESFTFVEISWIKPVVLWLWEWPSGAVAIRSTSTPHTPFRQFPSISTLISGLDKRRYGCQVAPCHALPAVQISILSLSSTFPISGSGNSKWTPPFHTNSIPCIRTYAQLL